MSRLKEKTRDWVVAKLLALVKAILRRWPQEHPIAEWDEK